MLIFLPSLINVGNAPVIHILLKGSRFFCKVGIKIFLKYFFFAGETLHGRGGGKSGGGWRAVHIDTGSEDRGINLHFVYHA
jgi:hypothetical protein